MKTFLSLSLIAVLMFFALSDVTTPTVLAADGCVIPESGPWPPCATGGGNSGGSSGCVIPESGPWPPCATGGGNSGGSNGCVIPESGPWPACATGGGSGSPAQPAGNVVNVKNTSWIVHQGRGTKETSIEVEGLANSTQIARIEVTIDFTFSASACSTSAQTVDKGVLGYSLISPSGTRLDLIEVGDLAGMQSGTRANMAFRDGGSPLNPANPLASGSYQPADRLEQLIGENPAGEWRIVMTKQSFDYAICQHSATLHITTK